MIFQKDYLVVFLAFLTLLFSIIALVVDLAVIEGRMLDLFSTKADSKLFDHDDDDKIISSIVFSMVAIIGAFVGAVVSVYNTFQEKNAKLLMTQLVSFIVVFFFSTISYILILDWGEAEREKFELFLEKANDLSIPIEVTIIYKGAFALLVSNSVMSLVNFFLVFLFK